MEEYVNWLENKIEVCLNDKELQREHWAFCQALKKYRELVNQTPVLEKSEQFICRDCGHPKKEYREQLCEPCHKWHTDS